MVIRVGAFWSELERNNSEVGVIFLKFWCLLGASTELSGGWKIWFVSPKLAFF